MSATRYPELLAQVDDQNFTFVSLASSEKQFPSFAQPIIDHQLSQDVDALLSFELKPDQPTDADVDRRLSLHYW